jgi:4-hydroxy-2-oxoheptanedioate aldolase
LIEAIQADSMRACLHNGTPEYAAKAVGCGFYLLTISNDVRLLASAAQPSITQTRKLIGEAPVTTGKTSNGY